MQESGHWAPNDAQWIRKPDDTLITEGKGFKMAHFFPHFIKWVDSSITLQLHKSCPTFSYRMPKTYWFSCFLISYILLFKMIYSKYKQSKLTMHRALEQSWASINAMDNLFSDAQAHLMLAQRWDCWNIAVNRSLCSKVRLKPCSHSFVTLNTFHPPPNPLLTFSVWNLCLLGLFGAQGRK